jgi:hypothetical protein
MNPLTRRSFWKSSACGTASGLLATAADNRDKPGGKETLRTGQPACDADTAKLVETLRANGAYLPQTELRKTMMRAA